MWDSGSPVSDYDWVQKETDEVPGPAPVRVLFTSRFHIRVGVRSPVQDIGLVTREDGRPQAKPSDTKR